MSDEQQGPNWEQTLRAMAQEVKDQVERLNEVDVDDVARRAGIDPDRARQWLDEAGTWVRVQVERVDDLEMPFPTGTGGTGAGARSRAEDSRTWDAAAEPHALDLPTADQGAALAALDSGRWVIEPGTSALVAHGDGPGPRDALGLVRELRVRDWVAVDGALTLAGRHALGRWLDASVRG